MAITNYEYPITNQRSVIGYWQLPLFIWPDGDRVQKRHHRAQLGPDLFDRLVLLAPASLVEPRAALLVLLDPFAGVGAVLDLREHFLHLAHSLFGDDARAAGI